MCSARSNSVYCVLCGNREKSVSYHKFPKQEETRKQWLAFCEINERVLNTATRLCSNHFHEEFKKKVSNGIVLKPNAVPSICANMKNNEVHMKNKMSKQSNSALTEVCGSTKQKYDAIDKENCNVLDTDTSMIVDNSMQSCESAQLSKRKTPKAISQSCFDRIPDSAATAEKLSQDVNCGPSTPVRDKATLCLNARETPTKTKHFPRYVNDIKSSHLASRKNAQRALEIAKRTVARQQRKIKTLQQARNRLTARITWMKALIKHLKKKNLLFKETAEFLKEETTRSVASRKYSYMLIS